MSERICNCTYPKWLEVAEKELGVAEIPGPADNPRILLYHGATAMKATDDSVPWCSSFVNWVLREAGIKGTESAAACSWRYWGTRLEIPAYGCVAVLWRNHAPKADEKFWPGHVGFWLGDSGKDNIRLLSGNTGDKVCIENFSKNRVLTYRWPQK